MTNTIKMVQLYVPDPSKFGTLSFGNMYFGTIGSDPKGNPLARIQVKVKVDHLWIDIPQPVELSAGGVPLYDGSPATIGVDYTEYAIAIDDSEGSTIYYEGNVESDRRQVASQSTVTAGTNNEDVLTSLNIGYRLSDTTKTGLIQTASQTVVNEGENVSQAMTPGTHSAYHDQLMVVEETHTPGTNGGSLNAGTTNMRRLTGIVYNSIGGATLEAGRVRLPAGKYIFSDMKAIAVDCGEHRLVLRTDGGSTHIKYGTCSESNISGEGGTYSFIDSLVFESTETKDYSLDTYCTVQNASDEGKGVAVGVPGIDEVYATLTVRKIK